MLNPSRKTFTFGAALSAYSDQSDQAATEEFSVPGDLTGLSVEELQSLSDQATALFDGTYGDGQDLSAEDMTALEALAQGKDNLLQELGVREAASAERAEAAAALASKVHPASQLAVDAEVDVEAEDGAEAADTEADVVEVEVAELASGPADIRVKLGGRTRIAPKPQPEVDSAPTLKDVLLAADVPGYQAGQGMEWNDVGRALDRRLSAHNAGQYAKANADGVQLRERLGVAVIKKPINPDLVINGGDAHQVSSVMRLAADQSRLPGGSLVASGGWCAPSETIYDLCELESRDGLFSLPEVGVARGGIKWTTGPKFNDIYTNSGFNYTEAEDTAGDYNGGGGGVKPCLKVACPPFSEARLNLAGVCISAGILQSRGYPEVLARTVRGALVAHDHRLSGEIIASLVAGSTAVAMTTAQIGSAAPLLDAIELQTEHFRYVNRLARNVALEAVFPYWIRGAVRSDLSRRSGVDLLGVTDAQINSWFTMRGIAPQFVYNWQNLTGVSSAFKAWPATVQFLLYAAGTWVRGSSDVITLDTVYDSKALGTNDFTALFSEEGWLTAKLCDDSRVVTVPLCPSGAANVGIDISCAGIKTP